MNQKKRLHTHKLTYIGVAILAVLITSFAVACTPDRITIEVDGSSTVAPITQRVAEVFREDLANSDIQIPIAISGTGGGFQRFITGETDISNASRPIRDLERQTAVEAGVEFIELNVAFDGISIVTHSDNDFVTCLTVDELKRIWEPSSTVNTWSQIRAEFPDTDINLYGPDRDSGTFDYFTAEIIGEEGMSRSDYSASANDNVLVQGVSADNGALGYFGFAYYQENTDKLRLIEVDDGEGCTIPDFQTFGSGTYTPLSRPLFIYVNTESLEREEVRRFVEFYLDNAAEISATIGYAALSIGQYETERAKLPMLPMS